MDVLAASRKAGLYQHFAIYIGNQRVIHYAAENGDFSGRITIHEAPYEEFRGDSTFIYILDFPDNSGRPTHRGQSCKTGVHESHQVNEWLTRLAKLAQRYIE